MEFESYNFDRPNPNMNGCPLTIDAGLIGRLLPGQNVLSLMLMV